MILLASGTLIASISSTSSISGMPASLQNKSSEINKNKGLKYAFATVWARHVPEHDSEVTSRV